MRCWESGCPVKKSLGGNFLTQCNWGSREQEAVPQFTGWYSIVPTETTFPRSFWPSSVALSYMAAMSFFPLLYRPKNHSDNKIVGLEENREWKVQAVAEVLVIQPRERKLKLSQKCLELRHCISDINMSVGSILCGSSFFLPFQGWHENRQRGSIPNRAQATEHAHWGQNWI